MLHLKNKNAASFGGATGRCCHSNIIETSTCWRASRLVCSHPETDAEHSLVHLRCHVPSRWAVCASNHGAHTVISPVRRLKPTLYNFLAPQLDSSRTVVVVFLQMQFFFSPLLQSAAASHALRCADVFLYSHVGGWVGWGWHLWVWLSLSFRNPSLENRVQNQHPECRLRRPDLLLPSFIKSTSLLFATRCLSLGGLFKRLLTSAVFK